MKRTVLVLALGVAVAVPVAAPAQLPGPNPPPVPAATSTPPDGPGPRGERREPGGLRGRFAPSPLVALEGAYRAIGLAEEVGVRSRYLDAAKARYRTALAAYGDDPRRAAAQAFAATSLARVAFVEHGPAIPRDLPPPPAPSAPPAPAATPPRRPGFAPPSRRLRIVDANRLQALEQRDPSPELRALVNDTVQASGEAIRARDRGDLRRALSQNRLAGALATAARAVAFADAPPQRRGAPTRRVPLERDRE